MLSQLQHMYRVRIDHIGKKKKKKLGPDLSIFKSHSSGLLVPGSALRPLKTRFTEQVQITPYNAS
ncbi:hypothetical protein IF1G_02977 [Cordyceps javanica]|uniref:Uncharacterized protein n=1 Tax=Cordyceps javanica TaxID=43265 RepID=A0A545VAY3_9HYPO|nr:hypothetical protein IF1G_02977 [Cordyceps javanica]